MANRGVCHPSPAELNRFLLGEMSPREASPILSHLLRGCDQCKELMEPLASVMLGTASASEPLLDSGSEYDFPLFKAFSTARRFAAAAAAAKPVSRAHRQAPPLRTVVVNARRSDEDMGQDEALCWKLIDHCQAIRFSDPEDIVLTALLAVNLSESLSSANPGKPELADLQARALGELGNARRIANQLSDAEQELSRALTRSGAGTGSPLLLAHLMDLTASLYVDQHRFADAQLLLDGVYAIYERLGERHLAGRALISRAVSLSEAYDIEEAARFYSQGLSMIDPVRDPKLVMRCVFNLIWTHFEMGQVAEAEALFKENRNLFAAFIERMDTVKITWLEARIAAALHQDARAETLFRDVRSAFTALQMHYRAAAVSLELSGMWLRAGRLEEIMAVVEETIGVFREHGIHREALGMLLIVRESIERRGLTAALLQETVIGLIRAERMAAKSNRAST